MGDFFYYPVLISNKPHQIEMTWRLDMLLEGYSSDNIEEALKSCSGDEAAAEAYLRTHYRAYSQNFDSRWHTD